MSSESSRKKIIAILKLILLVLIVAGIPAFLYLKYGSGVFSKDTAYSVIDYLRQNRKIAFLLIIGLQIIQVVICVLPGQPIQFAASYMFGVARGYLFSIIGAVIGTTISFCVSYLPDTGSTEGSRFLCCRYIRDEIQTVSAGCNYRQIAGHAGEPAGWSFFRQAELHSDDHSHCCSHTFASGLPDKAQGTHRLSRQDRNEGRGTEGIIIWLKKRYRKQMQ